MRHQSVGRADGAVLPGRRSTAVLLVAAPLLEIIEAALSPLVGSSTGADLAAIATHPGRFTVSVLIGLTSLALLVPALLGLAGACAPRSPRFARIAFWLMLAAMIGFVAVRTTQAFQWQLVRDRIDPTVAAALLDHTSSNPVFLPFAVLFLVGNLLGFAALAVATWRSGFPRPAVILTLLFPVAEAVDFDGGNVGAVLSHIVLLAGFAGFALALWSPGRFLRRLPQAAAGAGDIESAEVRAAL